MTRTVLYVNHTALPSGGEFALIRLLGAIDRSRVTPVVLLSEDGPVVGLLKDIDVETHVLPLQGEIRTANKDSMGGRAMLQPGRLRAIASYALHIARFARQHGVDIIHTNSMKAHIFGGLAGRIAGIPVVWHVRDLINTSYLPRPAVIALRTLARVVPTRVIGVSGAVLDQIRLPRSSAKGTVVHDGLAAKELAVLSAPSDRAGWHTPPRIGIVGRLMAWKGQTVFLDAAEKVMKSGKDATFVIVGGPLFGQEEYEKGLHAKARDLGIADRVEFMGHQKDIPRVVRDLDIVVHASTSPEPFGQVIIEGMAAGKPVIASDGGGASEIITHGLTGRLAPMGDAESLASEIRLLLNDPATAMRLGNNGAAEVDKRFTVANTARKVESVYDGLRGKRAQAPNRAGSRATAVTGKTAEQSK